MHRISHLLCLTPQLGRSRAPHPPRCTLHICAEVAIFALEILLAVPGERHDVDDKEAAEGRKPSLAENVVVEHVVIRRS